MGLYIWWCRLFRCLTSRLFVSHLKYEMYCLSCPACAFWMDEKSIQCGLNGPSEQSLLYLSSSFLSHFFHLSSPDVSYVLAVHLIYWWRKCNMTGLFAEAQGQLFSTTCPNWKNYCFIFFLLAMKVNFALFLCKSVLANIILELLSCFFPLAWVCNKQQRLC